jgi:outer membrane protein assembly factor BamB
MIALKVDFSNASFSVLWTGPQFGTSSPIVAGNAVWTIDTSSATLYALSLTNGTQLFSHDLGSVAHFETPSAAGGYVFSAGGNSIYAFSI